MSDGFFVASLPAVMETGSRVVVEGSEAHHAAVVRRLAVGESVTVTDGLGRGATGVVMSVSKSEVSIVVESVLEVPQSRLCVTVAQAFPKQERAELAVDLMTEVGVDEILGWAASRCQVKWSGERGQKMHGKWVNAAKESSKQSRRLRFPDVGDWAFVDDVVQRIEEVDCTVIMHERASRPITECDVPSHGSVLIIIGPEGGLTDDEVRRFEQAGGRAYSMGDTVLRTSTAGAIAVTQVRLLSHLRNS